jgi:transposase
MRGLPIPTKLLTLPNLYTFSTPSENRHQQALSTKYTLIYVYICTARHLANRTTLSYLYTKLYLMTMQQEQAYMLYIKGSATQKQIAAETGVSEKTIYNWIRQFNWHTERQEQHERYRALSQNVAAQLISCQQVIAEGKGTPTLQELNMQTRLINCILKLDTKLTKTEQADAMTAFLEYVANTNEELGNQLLDIYLAYAQSIEKKKANRKQPVKTSKHPETTGNETATIPPPLKPESAPITEQDFKDYKHLLSTTGNITDKHTTRFRGRFVNTRWLQYNLLQYCLPPTERRFIGDARKVLAETDPSVICQQIAQYLTSSKAA